MFSTPTASYQGRTYYLNRLAAIKIATRLGKQVRMTQISVLKRTMEKKIDPYTGKKTIMVDLNMRPIVRREYFVWTFGYYLVDKEVV